jgi:hypothetical protein
MTEERKNQEAGDAGDAQQEKKEKAIRRRFDHKANLTIAGLVSLFAIIIFGLSAFGTGETRDTENAEAANEDQPLIDLQLNDPQDLGLDYDPETLVQEALTDPDAQRLHKQLQEIVYE